MYCSYLHCWQYVIGSHLNCLYHELQNNLPPTKLQVIRKPLWHTRVKKNPCHIENETVIFYFFPHCKTRVELHANGWMYSKHVQKRHLFVIPSHLVLCCYFHQESWQIYDIWNKETNQFLMWEQVQNWCFLNGFQTIALIASCHVDFCNSWYLLSSWITNRFRTNEVMVVQCRTCCFKI